MNRDILILNIILLAIPYGLYVVFWDPLFTGVGIQAYSPASQTTSIIAYRGQLNEYDNTIKLSNDLIGRYGRLVDSYNSVDKTILQTIQKSVPDTIEELPFVSEVTKLIEKQGLDAGVVSVENAPDVNGMKVISYSFTTKGSYESLKNLISSIEQNVRFMAFRDITLSPPETAGDPYTLKAKVDAYKLR